MEKEGKTHQLDVVIDHAFRVLSVVYEDPIIGLSIGREVVPARSKEGEEASKVSQRRSRGERARERERERERGGAGGRTAVSVD